jgi:hypothetical protein
MIRFAIVELPDGMTVVEVQPGQQPEDAAIAQGGTLVDTNLYPSYDEAYDAMVELKAEQDDPEA